MTEKEKLPKAVCDALDLAKKIRTPLQILTNITNKDWVMPPYSVLNNVDVDAIMRALVLGYEPKLTVEEQTKALYETFASRIDYDEGYREGIRDALRIHGIHYDWLEGDAE